MDNLQKKRNVILIGAGIMSATLGSMLKELAPDWNIKVFEKLEKAGSESSNEWNNAGTGHAFSSFSNTFMFQSGASSLSIDPKVALMTPAPIKMTFLFFCWLSIITFLIPYICKQVQLAPDQIIQKARLNRKTHLFCFNCVIISYLSYLPIYFCLSIIPQVEQLKKKDACFKKNRV